MSQPNSREQTCSRRTANRSTAAIRRDQGWPRLQFSLRLLLLAFTAFAIGFPIWYRWPYEETLEQRDPATGALEATRISTWQRQWGGGRLLHGPHQIIAGDFVNTSHYVRGKRQGPFTVGDKKGRLRHTGQYADDMKEGVWIDMYGKASTTTHWHHDRLDGAAEFIPHNGPKISATFVNGRLTIYNGQPFDDQSFAALARRSLDKLTAAELGKETQIDVGNMPLKDVALYLAETHQIPIALDTIRGVNPDLPLTAALSGIDLRSALILLLAPHNLACDYRYGCLWITTADDAKDWHDPTGVSEIKPPKDSALSRIWNEPASIDAVQLPLFSALDYLQNRLAIHIDTTRIQPSADQPTPFPLTHSLKGIPFRHILGQILYKTRCRCRLEGETLIILPPDTE